MAEMTGLLLIVDVQNDFCPGGALAVPSGDEVVPVVNRITEKFSHVALTQDWHPSGHMSFASSHPGKQPFGSVELPYGTQTLWPDHCVQGSRGADFHKDLRTTKAELILRKGYDKNIDSYSAFFENDRRTPTGLAGCLRERSIKTVHICGLATDYCVFYSAMDAVRLGFAANVVEDACRGINLANSVELAMREMALAGVVFTASEKLLAGGGA
jgi:nicotinamidase/pyrazinamidase